MFGLLNNAIDIGRNSEPIIIIIQQANVPHGTKKVKAYVI